jgi:hypothetical protein
MINFCSSPQNWTISKLKELKKIKITEKVLVNSTAEHKTINAKYFDENCLYQLEEIKKYRFDKWNQIQLREQQPCIKNIELEYRFKYQILMDQLI